MSLPGFDELIARECAYTDEEIAEAQASLDMYSSRSPFWDTNEGQDVLDCAHNLRLTPRTGEFNGGEFK